MENKNQKETLGSEVDRLFFASKKLRNAILNICLSVEDVQNIGTFVSPSYIPVKNNFGCMDEDLQPIECEKHRGCFECPNHMDFKSKSEYFKPSFINILKMKKRGLKNLNKRRR